MHAQAELGVEDSLILVGATLEATKYISAFDLFLNTSVYEGLSIAALEAAQLGVLAAAQTRSILAVRSEFRQRSVFPVTTGLSERRIGGIGVGTVLARVVLSWIIPTDEFSGVVTLQRFGQFV